MAVARQAFKPNSYQRWEQQATFAEPPLAITGDADHYDHMLGDDPFQQPGDLFRLMSADEQQRLFEYRSRDDRCG
ncbi:hypothetical protein PCI56_03305 [Plesiomonas shigelloides subsp. oncorhynchi]|nr:hypothetical protein [Plesiomonas shigelloides]